MFNNEKYISWALAIWKCVPDSLRPKDFKRDPRGIDLNKGLCVKLHKEISWEKGRPKQIKFHEGFDGVTYSHLIAVEDIVYTETGGLLDKSDHTIKYTSILVFPEKEGDTSIEEVIDDPECNKVWTKYYTGDDKVIENGDRRSRVIGEAKSFIYSLKGSPTNATSQNLKDFFVAIEPEMKWFINEVGTNDLKTKLEDQTFRDAHTWMNVGTNWDDLVVIIDI